MAVITRAQLNDWFGKISDYLLTGWRSKVLTVGFLGLTAVIILQLLRDNWETIVAYDWQWQPMWLLGALGFFLIDLLFAAWAWHLMVGRLANYHNFRQSTKICWYANFARRIPSPVWYIAGRAVLYEKEGVSKTTISLLSGLELAFYFVSGLVVGLLTLPFWALPDEVTQNLNEYWLLLPMLAVALVLLHPKVLGRIWQRATKETAVQPLTWRDILAWFGVQLLTWVSGTLFFYSLINVLIPVGLENFVLLLGVWSLAGSISLAGALTISVIGLREVSLTLLLSTLIPAPIALLVAILVRIAWLIGELLSSLLSLLL